jgi:DnaJ like chaperone protein
MTSTRPHDIAESLSHRVMDCVDWLDKFSRTLLPDAPVTTNYRRFPSNYSAEATMQQTIFAYSIAALAIKLMRVDGDTNERERATFRQIFATEELDETRLGTLLASATKDAAPPEQYAKQLANLYSDAPDMRVQVVMRMCKIAIVDAPVTVEEFDFLCTLGEIFSIPVYKIADWLDTLDGPSKGDAYLLLKVRKSVDDEAVQSAYHERMRSCHPDRWSKGTRYAEMYRLANAKSAAINAAYRSIMRARELGKRTG